MHTFIFLRRDKETENTKTESHLSRVTQKNNFKPIINMRNKNYPSKTTEFRELIKIMDKNITTMDKNMEAMDKRFYDAIKAMHQELGGISKSNGEVAESYFVNSFFNSMQFAGQEYYSLTPNLRKKDKQLNLQGEYDLVMYNCTSVVILEIKYKARKKDVQELLMKAPIFKQLFPQYANYGLYLGLAAFHFEENSEKESIDQGIAVIKQVGNNMIINDKNLKLF